MQLSDQPLTDPLVELVREAANEVFADKKDTSRFPRAFGKYQLLEELGRGGMGVVYRARDPKLKRDLALKVILGGAHASQADRNRFYQEGESLAQFHHPSIVQIFEVNEYEGYPYLALELVDGPTLAQWLEGRTVPIDACVHCLLQLSNAIKAAHQSSIIHRDLKPSNVLVSRTDPQISTASEVSALPDLKVTDFGLAKKLDASKSLAVSGALLGTPAYMAPEQILGKDAAYDSRVDIYSLGAIFYELLTGRPPFTNNDHMALLASVIDDDPAAPRKLRDDVPKPIEAICLKCLSKSPAARYANVAELIEDLESYWRDEPVLARPPSWRALARRWARQHPALATSYLICGSLLTLHWFMKFGLQSPKHQSSFGYIVTFANLGWGVCSTLLDPLLRHPRYGGPAKYTYVATGYIIATIVLAFDHGPLSAPLPMLSVGVIFTGLLLPRMVPFATVAAVLAYLTLQTHAWVSQSNQCHSVEQSLAFVVATVLTGVSLQLWRGPLHVEGHR